MGTECKGFIRLQNADGHGKPVFISVTHIAAFGPWSVDGTPTNAWIIYGAGEDDQAQVTETINEIAAKIEEAQESLCAPTPPK